MEYLVLVGTPILLALVSLLLLLVQVSNQRPDKQCRRPVHLLVVLGSGGHTEEMLSMLRYAQLDPDIYTWRTYVVSSGDLFSARKAAEFEKSIKKSSQAGTPDSKMGLGHNYTVITVPRARKVHQSFWTAPLSTLQCLTGCVLLLMGRHSDQLTAPSGAGIGYPDIILTNGPGTGVCVVVAARLLRLFDYLAHCILPQTRSNMPSRTGAAAAVESNSEPRLLQPMSPGQRRGTPRYLRTVFIESWARVTTVSLSGKILFPLVDRFLVQWEDLAGYSGWLGFGRKAEYVGMLMS